MKILHTSDWHLGARLGRQDRLADQQVALRGLLDLADQVKPDLVLHTRGVFSALRPSDQGGSRGVVLYAAPRHLHGPRPGRSERRIPVGEDYAAHVTGLHRAMSAALGHIHDPQLVPGGTVTGRYAGSLIPIDFGEVVQEKQALVVTIGDGDVTVAEHPLPTGRPLTEFNGTVDQLEALARDGELNGHILKARVHSQDPITDLADRVLALSPERPIFDLINTVANAPVKPIDTSQEADREPDIRELFAEWRAPPPHAPTAPPHASAAMLARSLRGGQSTRAGPGTRAVMTSPE